MKWLILLFSVLKPFFSSSGNHEIINPVTELKEVVKANAMKVIAYFAAASSLATIFAAGIILIAVDVGSQYDRNAYVTFSLTIIMGLTLSLLSLAAGAIIARMFQDPTVPREREKREVLSNVGTSHPLQDALALLISDFVKEREMRRNQEEQVSTTNHYPQHTTDRERSSERAH